MRAVIVAFVVTSWSLGWPVCFAQASPAPSTAERGMAGRANSAQPSSPAVQSLGLKETIPLPYPAPPGFTSGVKCDQNGNIFVPLLDFNSDGTVNSTLLLEILLESKSTKTFGSHPLPPSEYPNQSIDYFDVDSAGTVYGLVYTDENGSTGDKQRTVPQYFIERFNSDGSSDSIVHLDYPPGSNGVDPYRFGVLPDGNFVVAGVQRAASGKAAPFTALYDSSGKFLRSVALPDDVLGDHTPAAHVSAAISAVTLGGLVSLPDGNVYLLRDSNPVRLYGVDSSGDVVKHFQLSPPLPGLNVNSVGPSGEDSLIVFFGHPPPQHPGEKPVSQYLTGIFNTVSGQFDAIYRLPRTAKAFGVPACGDQHGGLLFIGSIGQIGNRHLAVFDYGP